MDDKKILIVVGTRPNYMKVAPLLKEFNKFHHFDPLLIHTGQHYGNEMSGSFFKELNLPRPNFYLGVKSGSHAEQTGKIMIRFEKVCFKEKPDLVIVVGDVNSTIACALVAAKLCIPIAHVEAGLRSFDRTMPEEINRVLTDQISEFLFTTCEDANQNLIKEGIPKRKIFFVGNVMIDTLLNHHKLAKESSILVRLKLKESGKINKYVLVTLHRPSNVDDKFRLKEILRALNNLAEKIPIIFPIHPRTLRQITRFKLGNMINIVEKISSEKKEKASQNILAIPPLGYLDFLNLMSQSLLVLTDSGGIQEETTILGVPCLTIRKNTERPVTVKEGTNIIVGNNPDKILEEALNVMENGKLKIKRPKYWDGKAAERIRKILTRTI